MRQIFWITIIQVVKERTFPFAWVIRRTIHSANIYQAQFKLGTGNDSTALAQESSQSRREDRTGKRTSICNKKGHMQ